MDQVKKVLNFVWTYRFWFAIGIAVVLSIVTYPSGATGLKNQAERRKNELDKIHKDVENFVRGDHPNRKYISLAEEKKQEVEKQVEAVWEELYRKQQKLMTWPKNLQSRFGHRPFFADLSEERNKWLTIYFREEYEDQPQEVYYLLDPLEIEPDGTVWGTVSAPPDIILQAQFESTPTSKQAWLAQEQLWVQREIVRAIAKANEPAMKLTDPLARWRNAAVRIVVSINMGVDALDTKSANVQLINALADEPASAPPPGAGGPGRRGRPGGNNVDPVRYLEDNEQYRELPVSAVMLVDQMKIPIVLTELSNANFDLVLTQVGISVPETPVELPYQLRDLGTVSEAAEEEDEEKDTGLDESLFNTVRLEVYGRMRIYKMPPSMRAEYEKAIESQEYVREIDSPAGEAAAADGTAGEAKTEPAAESTPAPAEPKAEAAPAEPKAEEKPAAETPAEPKAEEKPAAEPPAEQTEAQPEAKQG